MCGSNAAASATISSWVSRAYLAAASMTFTSQPRASSAAATYCCPSSGAPSRSGDGGFTSRTRVAVRSQRSQEGAGGVKEILPARGTRSTIGRGSAMSSGSDKDRRNREPEPGRRPPAPPPVADDAVLGQVASEKGNRAFRTAIGDSPPLARSLGLGHVLGGYRPRRRRRAGGRPGQERCRCRCRFCGEGRAEGRRGRPEMQRDRQLRADAVEGPRSSRRRVRVNGVVATGGKLNGPALLPLSDGGREPPDRRGARHRDARAAAVRQPVPALAAGAHSSQGCRGIPRSRVGGADGAADAQRRHRRWPL